MKCIGMVRLAACTWVVLGAVSVQTKAQAQTQTQDSGSPAQAAAPASESPRAIRQANRLLARDVRRTLVRVRGLDSGNIVVVARGGSVMLGGSVPAANQIDLAVEAAKGVKGVTSVSEKLTIRAVGQ